MHFSDTAVRNYHISEVSRTYITDINIPFITVGRVKSKRFPYPVRSSLCAAPSLYRAVVRDTQKSEFYVVPVKRLEKIESPGISFIEVPFGQFRSMRLK